MGLIIFGMILLVLAAIIFSLAAVVVLAKIFIWACAAYAIGCLIKWIFD